MRFVWPNLRMWSNACSLLLCVLFTFWFFFCLVSLHVTESSSYIITTMTKKANYLHLDGYVKNNWQVNWYYKIFSNKKNEFKAILALCMCVSQFRSSIDYIDRNSSISATDFEAFDAFFFKEKIFCCWQFYFIFQVRAKITDFYASSFDNIFNVFFHP